IYHGNLEVSSDLRQQGDEPYHRLAEERRRLSPYRERRGRFTARISRDKATFVVRDEGPGVDPSCLPDPTEPSNLGRVGGRGRPRAAADPHVHGRGLLQRDRERDHLRQARQAGRGCSVMALIAEDDRTSSLMLQGMLWEWGYEVTAVADGTEALRVLQSDDGP